MSPISFKRHRFPATVIVQAVRWYFRFTLSIRDVEELMAHRAHERCRATWAARCLTTETFRRSPVQLGVKVKSRGEL